MDMETFDAINGAQTNIKEIEKMNNKLEDLLWDAKEAKVIQ